MERLSVKNYRDFLHPTEKRPGLFVRRTSRCIYKYLCVSTEVPLAEISFCIRAPPVIISETLGLHSLVTTTHLEIILCSDQFPMIVETTKQSGSPLI